MSLRNSWLLLMIACVISSGTAFGRVSRQIEDEYVQQYKNRALFLKIPVRGASQSVFVRDGGPLLDQSNAASPLQFKVGDQVRILDLRFGRRDIEFRLASPDQSRQAAIVYQFASDLLHSFPQRPAFDLALDASFTEGLTYQEIEGAKEDFIQGQFDGLIRQFATATGTSPDFVIRAVSERNPEYRSLQTQAAELKARADGLESDLRQERSQRQQFESELRTLRAQVAEARGSNEALQAEGARLADQNRSLERELAQLRQTNQHYQSQVAELGAQINGLAGKLDLETETRGRLDQQMQDLGRNIDALQSERRGLSSRLEQVSQELVSLQEQNSRLTEELASSRERARRLESDLGSLTSNRDSLEARFLETKRIKENFELANQIGAALRPVVRYEERDGRRYQVSDIHLNEHLLGSLWVSPPSRIGETADAIFEAASPNTVQFSDEERILYQALGPDLKAHLGWRSWSSRLEAGLVDGEAVQTLAPREEAHWMWRIEGDGSRAETASLMFSLEDVNGNIIPVLAHDFELAPSGFLANMRSWISLPSTLFGIVIGILLLIGVQLLRSGRKTSPRKARAVSGTQKEF